MSQIQTFASQIIEPGEPLAKAAILKNVIKVPVVLAAEMTQTYLRDELSPAIRHLLPTDDPIVLVRKPFEELEAAIANISQLPITINHPSLIPSEKDIVGYVKQIYADADERKIKGTAYINKRKIPDDLRQRIIKGEVIDVSIGGWTSYRIASQFTDGAFLEQCDISLNHLALLPDLPGRCPGKICGLNLDQSDIKIFDSESLSDADLLAHQYQRAVIIKNHSLAPKKCPKKNPSSENIKPISLSPPIKDQVPIMSEDLKRQIEDLVAQLRQKDAELGTLRDQANKVVSQKLQDAQTQIETLTKALDQKTTELNDTAEKLKKAEEKLKQFEDQQKTSLISELTDAKIGTEEELGKRSLHELQVMRETLAKAQILKEKTHVMDRGFPKPDQEQRKKPAPPQKQTLGAVVIDLNELKEKA